MAVLAAAAAAAPGDAAYVGFLAFRTSPRTAGSRIATHESSVICRDGVPKCFPSLSGVATRVSGV